MTPTPDSSTPASKRIAIKGTASAHEVAAITAVIQHVLKEDRRGNETGSRRFSAWKTEGGRQPFMPATRDPRADLPLPAQARQRPRLGRASNQSGSQVDDTDHQATGQ